MSGRSDLNLRSNHLVAVIGIERGNRCYVLLRGDGRMELQWVVAVDLCALRVAGCQVVFLLSLGKVYVLCSPWLRCCRGCCVGTSEAVRSATTLVITPNPTTMRSALRVATSTAMHAAACR